jgi:hypothetical protein
MEVVMENDIGPVDKVVAIPFPVYPRRVIYGRLAKVIDFLAWKKRMGKTNGEAENNHNETLEELKKMSPEAQKLWLIKKILQMAEFADTEDMEQLYDIIMKKHQDET